MQITLCLLLCILALISGVVYGSNLVQPDFYVIEQDNNPELVKFRFMEAITNGSVDEASDLARNYTFLTESFNRDIFDKFLKLADKMSETEISKILKILEPSFADLSNSTSTPLILAIRKNNWSVISELFLMKSVLESVDRSDEFGRTALMYAAKRGSIVCIRKILDESEASINFKDNYDKTAIHYACEMNWIEAPTVFKYLKNNLPLAIAGEATSEVKHKYSVVSLLIERGAEVYNYGPEYKLLSSDSVLIDYINNLGGKVMVKDIGDRFIKKALGTYLLAQLAHWLRLDLAALNFILNNPISALVNNICFSVQDLLLPGINLSFNFSVDAGDAVHDFSVSIVFMMVLLQALMQVAKNLSNLSFELKRKLPGNCE